MTIKRLLALVFIFLCSAGAWMLLGTSLVVRTFDSQRRLGSEVEGVWGPALAQPQVTAHYKSPASRDGRRTLVPASSRVNISLRHDPKRKGLLWYRTYQAEFDAVYEIENPTPISQTIYVVFALPAEKAEFRNFRFEVDGAASSEGDFGEGQLTKAVQLAAGERRKVHVGYSTLGTDSWRYTFGGELRARDFQLEMKTNFHEINFPAGTASTGDREKTREGYVLAWNYPEVRGLREIGMDMPSVVNPGPVAARMAFFAPVSLLFFFTVLFLVSIVRGTGLHPMNFFFLAAGSFAFQLLFAYLVDVAPILTSFSISAGVSMLLVSGYVWLVAGPKIGWPAAVAQFAYMVLFSYSFFYEGWTGLIVTCGAIVTLAILMIATAKVNWALVFPSRRREPPPIPGVA